MENQLNVERGTLRRASFNFLDHCNMRCKFCYLPFDGQSADLPRWKQVTSKLAELGAESITFGGGDPFKYRGFIELLKYIKADLPMISFVQVDTNGLGIRTADLDELPSLIDLLGLPVDGPTEEIHGMMRSSKGHLARVLGLVADLHLRVPLKINTVVSSKNCNRILDVGSLLSQYTIAWWSLYQFWPIGTAALAHEDEFALSDSRFTEITTAAIDQYTFAHIESGGIADRWKSYFFVSQTGRAYTVDNIDHQLYAELGSIFDADILTRWGAFADPALNGIRLSARVEAIAKRMGE